MTISINGNSVLVLGNVLVPEGGTLEVAENGWVIRCNLVPPGNPKQRIVPGLVEADLPVAQTTADEIMDGTMNDPKGGGIRVIIKQIAFPNAVRSISYVIFVV